MQSHLVDIQEEEEEAQGSFEPAVVEHTRGRPKKGQIRNTRRIESHWEAEEQEATQREVVRASQALQQVNETSGEGSTTRETTANQGLSVSNLHLRSLQQPGYVSAPLTPQPPEPQDQDDFDDDVDSLFKDEMLAAELRQQLAGIRQRNAEKADRKARLKATWKQNLIDYADDEDFMILADPEVDVMNLTEDREFTYLNTNFAILTSLQ